MLKRIIALILVLLIAVAAGYTVGINAVKQTGISIENYNIVDEICTRATTDTSGYETADMTRGECKVAVFKATGKL